MRRFSNILNEWQYNGDNVPSIYTVCPETKEELQQIVVERIKENPKKPYLLDIDTSKITDMSYLFSNFRAHDNKKKYKIVTGKIETLILNTWNVSNVESMRFMFYRCFNLETVDISGWVTSNVKNINQMFSGCYNLKEIKGIEDVNVSKINQGYNVFWQCDNLSKPSWYNKNNHAVINEIIKYLH